MTPTLEALYRAAQKADDDFQAAVVRQFGAKEAGDARYQYRTFNPATQPRRAIEVRHLHFDRAVNRTFASVMAPGFTQTFYVSGKVSAKQFIEWITPTVERMEAELG